MGKRKKTYAHIMEYEQIFYGKAPNNLSKQHFLAKTFAHIAQNS